MKITTGSRQPTIAQQTTDSSPEATESGATRRKTAAKPAESGDTVALSTSVETEIKNRQAEQAKRVESIKSLVKAGKYEVSSREVAEKILAGTAGK